MTKEMPAKKTNLPERVHPDDRARLAALGTLTAPPREGHEISYYTPELIQCTLPHSDPKCNPWIRKNGNFSLIISSGFDENGEPYGIPYGSFPRLTMAHVITGVVATRERRIELNAHFASYLQEIGYTSNHRGNGPKGLRVRSHLLKMLNANIKFHHSSGTPEAGENSGAFLNIASKYGLWWDFKNPDQGSLFGSWIELSQDFYDAILRSPVPLRTDILTALKKSPLALDVYMWVSYRLFAMQAAGHSELNVHYGLLQEQFGTGISTGNYRKFRQEFRLAMEKVEEHWRPHEGDKDRTLLKYDIHETGLTLYRSPLLIGRGQRRTAQEELQVILATSTFDQATRKQARAIAGSWNVDHLSNLYFDWIKREGITPKDPRAHFYDFIKKHRKLNGETV